MSQAFFVVGHEGFGKSWTLRALTSDNYRERYWSVPEDDRRFFIRRMSNDDRPLEWASVVEGFNPTTRPHVLIALCPKAGAIKSLTKMQQEGYALLFFVLRDSWNGNGAITQDELDFLASVGEVWIFAGKHDAQARARELRRFIMANPD